MEPADQVIAHASLVAVVEEPVHRGFVALGGVGLQLLAGGAEAGAPHQVADEFYIAVCHNLTPCHCERSAAISSEWPCLPVAAGTYQNGIAASLCSSQ